MTDGLPNPAPVTELPSPVTGFINLFLSHGLTVVAGSLGTLGALAPSQEAQFVTIGAALVLYLIGQGYAFIIQHSRHAQAVAAVASAKAS